MALQHRHRAKIWPQFRLVGAYISRYFPALSLQNDLLIDLGPLTDHLIITFHFSRGATLARLGIGSVAGNREIVEPLAKQLEDRHLSPMHNTPPGTNCIK